MNAAEAVAVAAGSRPGGLDFAADYPTEFSAEVAASAADGQPLGPYFLQRAADGLMVGELGVCYVAPRIVEFGYAIVVSARGRGLAGASVLSLIELARRHPDIDRLVAHTPLDRPASERVLANTGFRCLGQTSDEHDGVIIAVHAWQLVLTATPSTSTAGRSVALTGPSPRP